MCAFGVGVGACVFQFRRGFYLGSCVRCDGLGIVSICRCELRMRAANRIARTSAASASAAAAAAPAATIQVIGCRKNYHIYISDRNNLGQRSSPPQIHIVFEHVVLTFGECKSV